MNDSEASSRPPKRQCLAGALSDITSLSSATLTAPVLIVFALLDPRSLARLQATCPRFYRLIDENHHKFRKFKPLSVHIYFEEDLQRGRRSVELLLKNSDYYHTDACRFVVHFGDNFLSNAERLNGKHKQLLLLKASDLQINKTYSLYAAADVSTVEAFRHILRFLTKKASFTNVELTSAYEDLLPVLAEQWIPCGLRSVCLQAIGDELANDDSLLNFLNTVKPSEFKLGKFSARNLPPRFFAHSAWNTVTKLEIETVTGRNLKCTFGDEHLNTMTNLRQLGLGRVFTQLTASGLLKWALAHFQAKTDVILLSRVSTQVVNAIRSNGAAFIAKHFAHKLYQEIQQRNGQGGLLECVQGNYKLQIGQFPVPRNCCALIRIKTFREPDRTNNSSCFEIRTKEAVQRSWVYSAPLKRLEPCLQSGFVLIMASADFVAPFLMLLCPKRTCRLLYFHIEGNRHKLRKPTPDKVLVQFCADDLSGVPAFELTLTNAKRFRQTPPKFMRLNSKDLFSDRHMANVTEANSTLFEDFRNIFKFITKRAKFRKAQINTANADILTILAEKWKTSEIPYFCYDQSQDGVSESLVNFLNIAKPEMIKLRHFAPENLPSTFFTESFWSALKTFKLRRDWINSQGSFSDEELQAMTNLRELDLRLVFTPRLTADGLLSWALARLKAQKTAFLLLRVSKNVYGDLLSRATTLKWPMQEDERELFYSQGERRLEIQKLRADNEWDQLRVEILVP